MTIPNNADMGLRSKLCSKLRDHVQHVDLDTLSRVSSFRLATTALPNIDKIELVSGDDFELLYDELYVSMFPGYLERERSDLIVDRLKDDFAGRREGLSPYRVVGIRDHAGQAVGAAQFSILRLAQSSLAVPYLQYIYIRTENRRQDLSEVLHTMVLAVASADAAQEGRTVPGTLFECEPPGYGKDEVARLKSTLRVQIHAKAGASALMLRRPETNTLQTCHVQPGLEPEDPPTILIWAVRPSPSKSQSCDITAVGAQLLAAYYQSLRDEGFPLANIALGEHIATQRRQGCVFELTSLLDVLPTPDEYLSKSQ